MSHTVQVAIEFRDTEALTRAVESLGGSILGHGTYKFGGTTNTGFGFKLSGWQVPCVATADGMLKFDDYNGHWGNVADLELLKAAYAAEVTLKVCTEQGWITQKESDGSITVFAEGGQLTILANGEIDANGYQGAACERVINEVAEALGQETTRFCKPEHAITVQQAKITA